MPPDAIRMSARSSAVFLVVLGLVLAVMYCTLSGTYRPAELDDAWTASYVWNLTHKRSTVDTVFGQPSNIRYFGHIHAYAVSAVADVFGWSKGVFHAFNTLCMAGAALAWLLSAARLLRSVRLALVFILLLYMLEPFLGASFKARSDAFAFLFFSWGVYAAVRGRFFMAAFLNSIAVEVHAVAGIGYCLIAALVLSSPGDGLNVRERLRGAARAFLWCALGAAVGFAVYRFIHPESFRDILAYLGESNREEDFFANAFTAHYFSRAYFRFLPELFFLVCGAAAYFFKRKQVVSLADPLSCLFWMTCAAALIIRRENFHYIIFFYPPLFLIALSGFARTRFFLGAVLCLALYAASLAGGLAWMNRKVDHPAFDRGLLAAGIVDDGLPVLGPANAWHVLRERDFYVYFEALQKAREQNPGRVYYVQSVYSSPMPDCARDLGGVGEPFSFNGSKVEVRLMDISRCSWPEKKRTPTLPGS